MNLYCRLSVAKKALGGFGSGTGQDAALLTAIESVSRELDTLTGRRFYARDAQTVYAGRAGSYFSPAAELRLPMDFASLTTVTVDEDGDGVYELTLVENTDYWTEPENRETHEPITALYLDPNGTQLGAWPRHRRAVKLVGATGYSRETELTGSLLSAAIASTSATTFTIDDGTDVEVGETIIVDSEQMDITAISTNTLTVVRGINGSTAATHLDNTVVYRRRYHRIVEAACAMKVSREFRGAQVGHLEPIGADTIGAGSMNPTYPMLMEKIYQLRSGAGMVA